MERGESIRLGLANGLPIALGYLPIAVTFGILARQAGLAPAEAAGMSAWVYAGASQFLAVKMIAAGLSFGEIIVATFILNFRHFLMSTALSQKLGVAAGKGAILSYGVTDETFVMASIHTRPEELSPLSFLAMAGLAYIAWFGGSLTGALFSALIPVKIVDGMGIGLYAVFIALLIPSVRKSWRLALIALASALTAWVLSLSFPGLSEGWTLIVATLGVSALGILLPAAEEKKQGPGDRQ
jgi:4-azaleucine resistance transporter AzlC